MIEWCKDECIRQGYAMPTADVAPMSEVESLHMRLVSTYEKLDDAESEVERLETEIKLLTENSISAKYPHCVLCGNGAILTKSLEEYDKMIDDISAATKAEVAREIIDEIKRTMREYDQTKFNPYGCTMLYLNELEKKYTEEKQ